MIEAHLINTPREINRELYFSVVPNLPNVDMASICSRCDLNKWCYGTLSSRRKDAHLNLDAPRIRRITSSDTSNCGIILDILAKKDQTQSGFTPLKRALGTN